MDDIAELRSHLRAQLDVLNADSSAYLDISVAEKVCSNVINNQDTTTSFDIVVALRLGELALSNIPVQ